MDVTLKLYRPVPNVQIIPPKFKSELKEGEKTFEELLEESSHEDYIDVFGMSYSDGKIHQFFDYSLLTLKVPGSKKPRSRRLYKYVEQLKKLFPESIQLCKDEDYESNVLVFDEVYSKCLPDTCYKGAVMPNVFMAFTKDDMLKLIDKNISPIGNIMVAGDEEYTKVKYDSKWSCREYLRVVHYDIDSIKEEFLKHYDEENLIFIMAL